MKSDANEDKEETDIKITENEKLLLIEIENQNKKIQELQNTLNSKFESNTETNAYITFLQKRISELLEDSKRYFDRYKSAKSDYLKLLHNKAKDLRGLINKHIKNHQLENNLDKKIYYKRVEDMTKEVYDKKVKELSEKLKVKEEQEEKIEIYINKLISNYKEVKNDIVAILILSKKGKAIPREYFEKYSLR